MRAICKTCLQPLWPLSALGFARVHIGVRLTYFPSNTKIDKFGTVTSLRCKRVPVTDSS